ncbi:MAG: alpha/beta hydrolase [Methanoregula sp.]|nr:alpha/beta hydrolase [Methanoregula sp.]
MIYPLNDELLLIRTGHSFLLVGKVNALFGLCIETSTNEFCQTVDPTDIVVVSAPEGGAIEPAIMLIEFVRTYHLPLIVLPKDHPGSKRFSYLISVAPEITTNCSIQRGTHPEQHLVCSSEELAGINLKGIELGVEISPVPEGVSLQMVKCQIKVDYLR